MPDDDIPERMLLGEGWIICRDCGARLGSFDLPPGEYNDQAHPCPDPKACRAQRPSNFR